MLAWCLFITVRCETVDCTCVGYFVSDCLDIIAYGQIGAMRDVLIHHISVCSVDCIFLLPVN